MKAKDKSTLLPRVMCVSRVHMSKYYVLTWVKYSSKGPSVVREHGALHTQTNHLKINFVLNFLKKKKKEIVIRGCVLAYWWAFFIVFYCLKMQDVLYSIIYTI